MNPRVRFAPSPTGQLHIGGARTALFNYLFARKNSGKFLVRIEDTDLERSKQEYTDQICESMTWLGLMWDDELVYQSKRTGGYIKTILALLESGNAYRCFASKDELEKIRDKTGSYSYPGLWRDRSEEDIQIEMEEGKAFTVRLRIPGGKETIFDDLIYGTITVCHSELDDFIIARSDGSPVYNLTNAVDDSEMGITHVIRGEDHIANTPKQILIYQALGLDVPTFAHLPMILGQDKKRLSKRHGATGVQFYRNEGYQPEALLNYLSLLGWNPGTEEEVMFLDEIIQKFDLTMVHKKGAVFDEKKLNWISGQHLVRQSNESILSGIEMIHKDWRIDFDKAFKLSVINLMKIRAKSLVDLMTQSDYFFSDPHEFDEKDVRKTWKNDTPDIVSNIQIILMEIDQWDGESLEKKLKSFMEEKGLGFGKVMKPIRLAICGTINGPSLFEILSLLGKDICLRRLKMALSQF
ncbi:MAG TPA: glutamate--tRNA ligase [Candidatus Marinimicrobia bacterium]|nr:glutamate--tRNA ligase [Candidatus Neomarinimicrobiota bacterium]